MPDNTLQADPLGKPVTEPRRAAGAPGHGVDVALREALVLALRSKLPSLLAVYAFGSRVRGTSGPESDLDLAVLVDGRVDPLQLWGLAGDAADLSGCPVDLLDLREASTVMRYQVVTTGERWWARDGEAALFEVRVLGDKTALDEARAGLLGDIFRSGSVHGR